MGVTGGIAAYKACQLVSLLRKQGARVFVVMTKNACEFVQPLSFQVLSNNPVACDLFERPATWEVEHVALAKKADLVVIAPASANTIAKLALGLADDMLSTVCLATKAPLLLAPAMNVGMWENPATQANLSLLQARGFHFVGPESGLLACGDRGEGRMSEAESILMACSDLLSRGQDMQGLNVLVTAGPTREMIDPVRYISNRSSGKMGYALAEAAALRGARVTLVSGPSSLKCPDGVELLSVLSTDDLFAAMKDRAKHAQIIIQAAAPADYRPVEIAAQKIKKKGDEPFTLALKQTQDVARYVGEHRKPDQVLVGFAAETENLKENGQKKLLNKSLDLLVANDVSRTDIGFDVDNNMASFISAEGVRDLPLMSKKALAGFILEEALSIYTRKGRGDATE